MTATLLIVAAALSAAGEIREHPGGKELPHDKYIRVISEADSPVQQVHVKTKDGLYVAAALRKPKGDGPFPALVIFHGYPGGRGMEQLVGWSRGTTGGPAWERFLQEGHALDESVKFLREPAHTPADPPKTFSLQAIDDYVRAQVRENGYPGLSLAIVREGLIVLAKGYGKRSVEDGAPVEPDTMFAVGSVTKQFACACILLLAEEGKLSVDDQVAKYYPALTSADRITLYDLMTHTSGYRDYYPLDFVDRRLVRPIHEDPLLAEYAGTKLDFEPGARWSYSNTGYVLLGRVVEKVSGKPFGQYLKERILDPIGMTHSAIEPGSDVGSRARGYTAFALGPLEPAVPEATGWLSAAGNLWASAPDLARWDLALAEGRLLKLASFRLMTSPRVLRSFRRTGYGCGLSLRQVEGEAVLSHFGSISGFQSFNAIVPRTRSAVVLLTNSEHLNPGAIHSAILQLLVKDQKQPVATDAPKVQGPSPKEVALDFLHQMQSGKLNRQELGEEFNAFLTDERVQAAAPGLKALGEPETIEVESIEERGGMEVTTFQLAFKTAKLRALLYRTPDGKIQQLLFRKS